jgi:leucyl-tRNA synthetase
MWEALGGEGLCSLTAWPEYDEEKTKTSEIEIAFQVCGKTKGTVLVPAGCDEDTAFGIINANEKFVQYINGKTIIKKIYVKDKIFNIVVK